MKKTFEVEQHLYQAFLTYNLIHGMPTNIHLEVDNVIAIALTDSANKAAWKIIKNNAIDKKFK